MRAVVLSTTYQQVIARFHEVVRSTVPRAATVAVVSRGDGDLLKIEGARGWHFPQRADGVYLGYYPPDSSAAIQHLEALRERGAEFLAFPPSSLWWLEHYDGFARHLDDNYDLVVRDDDAGALYALAQGAGAAVRAPQQAPHERIPPQPSVAVPDDARVIFDEHYYAQQAGSLFDSPDEALTHYLERGSREGLDPHPLFDARWYVANYPEAERPNPLLHFVERAPTEALDPNPFFDTGYYYEQRPELHKRGGNALVHYLRNAVKGDAASPNPLFRDPYYLRTYADVRGSGMAPLEHYLRFGRDEGRYVSPIHRNLLERLQQSSVSSLVRGRWNVGSVLAFLQSAGDEGLDALALAERLAAEYRLDAVMIVMRRSRAAAPGPEGARLLVLEDFEMACEIFRPSALRLVAHSLVSQKPVFAVSEVADVVETLARSDVPTYLVADRQSGWEPAGGQLRHARGIVTASRRIAQVARAHGARVSCTGRGVAQVERLVKLAARDLRLVKPGARASGGSPTKVVIPCSDWSVSGVNAAIEAVGRQLIEHGWDVEILFTREPEAVLESAQEAQLPLLPFRFLERARPGVDGMWEALISEIERAAPCIAFLAYDFIGNCIVPALTDDVGVIAWLQADDGDYYEQTYRLGRYCNAIVCVSTHIRQTLAAMNPALGERAHVIHNSSVRADEVLRRRRRGATRMRLVYSGRLVQYQKRILDYVDLARALDRTGVDYEISLIGSFVAREGMQPIFEREAAEHLADGRIRVPGRLPRDRILEELAGHAFFVLVSDFEGLPLALVEAMARGCVPIVANSDSGIPELVTSGHDGVILDSRDYGRWAELMVELWNDRTAFSRMSQNARATVRERFTIETIGRHFDKLFREVAADVASGRYTRPPALHWGLDRSPTGDVLAAPSLYRPGALRHFPGLG